MFSESKDGRVPPLSRSFLPNVRHPVLPPTLNVLYGSRPFFGTLMKHWGHIKRVRHPLVPAARSSSLPLSPHHIQARLPHLIHSNSAIQTAHQFHSSRLFTMPTYIVRSIPVLLFIIFPQVHSAGYLLTRPVQVTCKKDATPEQVQAYAGSPSPPPRNRPMLTSTLIQGEGPRHLAERQDWPRLQADQGFLVSCLTPVLPGNTSTVRNSQIC